MGVTYKLKDEVVHFIISQKQEDPLSSCRQLAESASQKFGLHLSKSSVHDVLKESGIVTPRGRKPRPKFEIPQEKKKQIQVSISGHSVILASPTVTPASPTVIPAKAGIQNKINSDMDPRFRGDDNEISPEYEGAGKIFLKAAFWDLGIFPEKGQESFPILQEADWKYFLTYSKGVRITLENNKNCFIDLPLPIERCIREVADGLINNTKPFVVHKVSDENLFKACMEAQAGFKINRISVVDENDHVLLELSCIVEHKRLFIFKNRIFMENDEISLSERAKALFFPQPIENISVMDNVLNLKGFDATSKQENVVTLLIDDSYENKSMLENAAERLNAMYLRDEQDRLVRVKIQ